MKKSTRNFTNICLYGTSKGHSKSLAFISTRIEKSPNQFVSFRTIFSDPYYDHSIINQCVVVTRNIAESSHNPKSKRKMVMRMLKKENK